MKLSKEEYRVYSLYTSGFRGGFRSQEKCFELLNERRTTEKKKWEHRSDYWSLSIPRFHRNEIIKIDNEEKKWISSSNLKTIINEKYYDYNKRRIRSLLIIHLWFRWGFQITRKVFWNTQRKKNDKRYSFFTTKTLLQYQVVSSFILSS